MRTAISPRLATSTRANGGIPVSLPGMPLADQLTIARAASVALVVVLFVVGLPEPPVLGDRGVRRGDGHRPGRRLAGARQGQTSTLGSVLDRSQQGPRPRHAHHARWTALSGLDGGGDRRPRAPVSGLRLAAIERGVVIRAGISAAGGETQAVAAAIGGLPRQARGATTLRGGPARRSFSRSSRGSTRPAPRPGYTEACDVWKPRAAGPHGVQPGPPPRAGFPFVPACARDGCLDGSSLLGRRLGTDLRCPALRLARTRT